MSAETLADLAVETGGGRTYPIRFVRNAGIVLTDIIRQHMEGKKAIALVTDLNLQLAYPALFEELLANVPTFVVSPGEPAKSLHRLGEIWDFLAGIRMDRKGTIIAMGGGVIGDLAGFAAASFLRGVAYYQVPTTLLSMVDSSIGGKTGINIPAGKNLVGAFYHPQEVLIDTSFLETLPPVEFSAGMAEVLKYGLLGDLNLFERLESLDCLHPQHSELPSVIRRCCEIKALVVKEDERENSPEGGRALLNLGHTFGHAVEQVAGYGVYLHGEAVAIGMVAAAEMSRLMGWVSAEDVDRVVRILKLYKLPVTLRSPLALIDLIDAMQRDKKVRQGIIRFVAMRGLGTTFTTRDIPEEIVRECLAFIGAE